MIIFRTLGAAELKNPEGQSVQSILARPKLLGLLAYLAAATPGGFHSRDRLLGLLWGDLDEERGRRALRQSLYHLRRALGDEAIVARGDNAVGLDEDVVWCDARAFEDALERESPQDALQLYGGNLLDGFNLPGAPGFERWLDDRREELRRSARVAAWYLAQQAEAEQDSSGAVDWARRAVDLDPFDETLVRDAIQLLDRLGNRSGAVREFEAFARRLDEELGLQPSPETQELAESVRARSKADPPEAPPEGGTSSTDSAADPAAEAVEIVDPDAAASVPRRRRPAIRALAAVLLVATVLTVLAIWPRGRETTPPTPDVRSPRSIAVLPFENLSGDEGTEPFVAGIHEDILIHLYKIAGLRPISRTSVMEYRDTRKNLRQIADELGVAVVLEGGVQRVGDRVRITVQLIDADTDEHIWAEVYERQLTAENVFVIQTEISKQVAASLRARLTSEEAERIAYQPTRSLEAYDAYLTARDYQRRWRVSEENRRIAVAQYERAIELEPEFALAYADLSEFQSRACSLYGCTHDEMARTSEFARKALDLEPDLPQAHVALGNHFYYAMSDHDRAAEEYLRAIELEPNNGHAHGLLAAVRARTGKLTEALPSARRAVELNPREPDAFDFLGYIYSWLRDYEAAILNFDRSIALAPDVFFPRFWKAWAILNTDGEGRALETWKQATEALGDQALPLSIVAHGRSLVRSLGPEVTIVRFPDDRPVAEVSYLLSRAASHEVGGDRESARAWYDSARVFLEGAPADLSPEYWHSALGVVHARLGREADAVREATRAVELMPVSADAWEGPWFVAALAETLVITGDHEAALDRLEYLLSIPCPISPPLLLADPLWEPLHGHPRFQRLVETGQVRP
jgi:TolB-like protein/DNA-binding SARP family transcriptional activator